MFISSSSISVREIGPFYGRYSGLGKIVEAACLDEVQTPGPLYNGKVLLVDWDSPDFANPEKYKLDQALPLTILARTTTYFEMLIMHEGAHPAIKEHVNGRLHANDDLTEQSLDSVYNAVAQMELPNNPLSRPAPVGLSVNFTFKEGKIFKLLAVKRASDLAINPGVWTTAVDEGMHILDNKTILLRALQEEAGLSKIESESALNQLTCVGFHAPDRNTIGPRAGGNILYELSLGSIDELESICSRINGPNSDGWNCEEACKAQIVNGFELDNEISIYDAAPILRYAARWKIDSPLNGVQNG